MRKIILIFSLVSSFFVSAQEFNFGIKAGANYSDASVVNTKANSILSYHLGIVTEFKFLKFGIQPELHYSVLGADFDGNVVKSKARVGYLSLPVLAKIYFFKKLSVEAGPQVSYAMNEDTEVSLSGINLGNILEVNNLDFALVAGLGLDITDHLFVQGRFIYGLNEVTKNTNISQIDAIEVKNKALQLSLGYKF
ncbi:porin family protein [Flavobacterium sp.]|uniref:porin family protein n=1 Tax=Flavobacterium sp. TaxID=239 RepID=UPI00286DAE83|nr:porin family protein [Flavobacterium sp.]